MFVPSNAIEHTVNTILTQPILGKSTQLFSILGLFDQ
jgi:hypothetical protein